MSHDNQPMLQRKRRWFIAATSVLAIMGVLAFSAPASADFFGGRYADNGSHYFSAYETNDADYNQLNPIFVGSMASLDNLTDMSDVNRGRYDYANWMDMYWYATDQTNFSAPTVNGDATCIVTLAGNKCDRFRIRMNEDRLWRSTARITHTVCHEILHTVGFDDGDWRSSGCLPGWGTSSGFSDDTTMNSHEINHINAQY